MGLIRKALSIGTLGAVDFRSDKERTALYTRQTRDAVRQAGAHFAPRATPDPLSQLERLRRLRDQGALTPAQFEEQKARIIAPAALQPRHPGIKPGWFGRLWRDPKGQKVVLFVGCLIVVGGCNAIVAIANSSSSAPSARAHPASAAPASTNPPTQDFTSNGVPTATYGAEGTCYLWNFMVGKAYDGTFTGETGTDVTAIEKFVAIAVDGNARWKPLSDAATQVENETATMSTSGLDTYLRQLPTGASRYMQSECEGMPPVGSTDPVTFPPVTVAAPSATTTPTTVMLSEAAMLEASACNGLRAIFDGQSDPDPTYGFDAYDAAELDPDYAPLEEALHSTDPNSGVEIASACYAATGIDVRRGTPSTIPTPTLTTPTATFPPPPTTLPGASAADAAGCDLLDQVGQTIPIPNPVPPSEAQQVNQMFADFAEPPNGNAVEGYFATAAARFHAAVEAGSSASGEQSETGTALGELCAQYAGNLG
jgi:hypothetical protein